MTNALSHTDALKKSRFRSRFKLDEADRRYIRKTGLAAIRKHALDFIGKRLAPENPENDGRQTPFKGHPVFKAQHATATCCRGCLEKWYGIRKGKTLSEPECCLVVQIIMTWMDEQLARPGPSETASSEGRLKDLI